MVVLTIHKITYEYTPIKKGSPDLKPGHPEMKFLLFFAETL